ncbi:GNAT family N-acetyltransferase [Streptomyces sp. NA04227]|uniref:GNAT family N-acetyltransferase n=1 Tax=Streptomyces sp. NA04227 TaxID=2742136 RepID=UPI0015922D09|nr:GNAT family N-acetyltransferase [Streptomyces sp. NA04227]QKW05694.1 GNAT family N-acetyltransferase [Streptomyces sp. NA04227]
MTLIVRDLRRNDFDDAENFVRARRAAMPFLVMTAEGFLHDLAHAHPDKKFRLLVAEEDGEVLGTAQAGLAHEAPEPGLAFVNPYVRPDRLRRGAGALLLRTAEEHLARQGARRVFSWVLDEPGNRDFAARHGYLPARQAHFLRLDLAAGPLPPLPERMPPGVEVRSAASFTADPRPLFRLDAECAADEPSDVGSRLENYEEWLQDTWDHPLTDRELTTVVLVDGLLAAFCLAETDGLSRYHSGMTGTARAFRGRGLAKLAKNASLHRARAAGYREAFTGNDSDNGPMLAINESFGYRRCGTEVRHVRELGGPRGTDS